MTTITDETALPPSVMWAQRSEAVFLTINLEDAKTPEIKIENDSVYFKGIGGVEKRLYEVTIPLYQPIDAAKSRSFNRERCIEFILIKENQNAPFWPYLTKDKKKHHWLKCDFNKWQDEYDSGEEAGMGGGGPTGDFQDILRQMGGLDAGDSDKPNFYDDEPDSDDDALPDLE